MAWPPEEFTGKQKYSPAKSFNNPLFLVNKHE